MKNVFLTLLLLGCIPTVLLSGCATSGDEKPVTPTTPTAPAPAPPTFDRVTFEHPMNPIGDMVRRFGEEMGGGMVLMSGIEERSMPAVDFRQTPYQDAVNHFATSVSCVYLHTPYYYLIVPSGYEPLLDMHLLPSLDARYHDIAAAAAFGAKTELHNIFAVLGKSLGITIVADNFIAEARCGEMFLAESPLYMLLAALLQSARIAPGTFVLESTPDYIFVRASQNDSQESLLLNSGALTRTQRERLSKTVSLTLPEAGSASHAAFTATPIPLHDALLPLTEQLGIEIVAQRRLADIPINPCHFSNVRLDTALNLLLRQWPVPGFGFEMQENRILIREK